MRTKRGSSIGFISIFVLTLTLSLTLTLFVSRGFSAIPQKINYQGYLTNAQGVPVTGSIQMVFAIYDALSSGTKLWEETHNVNVTSGVYNVILGEGTPPTPINLLFDIPYYLSVRVGADPDMAPRVPLTSVGYAFRAQNAESGGGWTHTTGVISLGTGTDKVGIGTTTPSEELHVKGSGYLQGVFESTNSSGGIQLASSNGEKYELQTVNDGSFILYDRKDGRYVMNVDTNGNVGFGTNTPTGKLQGEISSNLVGHSIYGAYGKASGNMGSNYGVFGESSSILGGSNYGIYGRSSGNVSGGTGYAVYGENTGDGYGGYFVGDGYFSGNVGIGTTSPGAKLDVVGEVWIRDNALIFTDSNGTPYPDNWIGKVDNIDGNTKWLHIGGITDAGARRLALFGDKTYINGNLGIGTYNPQARLDVNGDVHVSGTIKKTYASGSVSPAIPIAFGGVLGGLNPATACGYKTGSQNFNSYYNATEKCCEITIDNEPYSSSGYFTFITFTTDDGNDPVFIAQTRALNGKLLIYVKDTVGVKIDPASLIGNSINLDFVVYKN